MPNIRTLFFFCDVAAGVKFPIGMSMLIKRWRSNSGFPDLYIFTQRGGLAMLQLELKTEDAEIYKADGTLRKNEHVEKQNQIHIAMRQEGYFAMFTVGINHTRAVVDWYMAGAEGPAPSYQQDKCEKVDGQVNFLHS